MWRQHAQRVLRILGLEDQIEGIVYCDYRIPDFVCKPEPEYYKMVCALSTSTPFLLIPLQAMAKANLTDPSKCYFVDDNRGNVEAAVREGWGHCVHFCEKGLESVEGGKVLQIDNEPLVEGGPSLVDISSLEQLRAVWPEIFIQAP